MGIHNLRSSEPNPRTVSIPPVRGPEVSSYRSDYILPPSPPPYVKPIIARYRSFKVICRNRRCMARRPGARDYDGQVRVERVNWVCGYSVHPPLARKIRRPERLPARLCPDRKCQGGRLPCPTEGGRDSFSPIFQTRTGRMSWESPLRATAGRRNVSGNPLGVKILSFICGGDA